MLAIPFHVFGVGVEDVVVAGEPGEDDDVGLGDGPSGKGELLADGEILEKGAPNGRSRSRRIEWAARP
jgi:hypothetical protein